MREVNNQNLWNFDLGSQEGMNVPICVIIGFQQRNRQDSQDLNNDFFCILTGTIGQCMIRTKKYSDAGILINYDYDDFSEGDSQIGEAFRA